MHTWWMTLMSTNSLLMSIDDLLILGWPLALDNSYGRIGDGLILSSPSIANMLWYMYNILHFFLLFFSVKHYNIILVSVPFPFTCWTKTIYRNWNSSPLSIWVVDERKGRYLFREEVLFLLLKRWVGVWIEDIILMGHSVINAAYLTGIVPFNAKVPPGLSDTFSFSSFGPPWFFIGYVMP